MQETRNGVFVRIEESYMQARFSVHFWKVMKELIENNAHPVFRQH
ncbi:MAG: hypothetical protein ACXW0H_08990 [Methylobacter sp.]